MLDDFAPVYLLRAIRAENLKKSINEIEHKT